MKKLLTIFIALLFCFNTSYSQTTHTDPESKIPNLGGHAFPSLSQFKSSFVSTSLQANMGFGITSPLEIQGFNVGGHEIFSFEGQLLFLNVDVQYQQRFNPWLALFLSFNMAGRMGTDMSTIVADGVSTIAGGDIGWLIRIYQNKKLNLSGSVKITNVTGNFINVSDYFEDLINDVPDPRLARKIPSMSAGIGVHGAYAFSPVFGLQLNASYAIGESFNRDGSKGYFSGGLMADADFMPTYNVPIGLALGYSLTSAPDIVTTDGGITHLINGKIGYTGSSDYELGLQYSYYKLKLNSVDESTGATTFTLILKLYF